MTTASIYAQRRAMLWHAIQKQTQKTTATVIFAELESNRTAFWQDSSFYYFAGIQEPGWVLMIDEQGAAHMYVPETSIDRSIWLNMPDHSELDRLSGPYQWHPLGEPDHGYNLSWYAPQKTYAQLLSDLATLQKREVRLSSAIKPSAVYSNQHEFSHKIADWLGGDIALFDDCSDIVSSLRRIKDATEIAAIKKAIDITRLAQSTAAEACKAGISEAAIKAVLEAVMTTHGSRPAFPSIVATGMNGTVLHYTGSSGILKNGDLVVVDIGASWQQYAADITRTYAVAGSRSARQQDLYQRVLAVQQEIAALAKPGMWLRNEDQPEQSLHHIAVNLFKKQGLADYFVHGIGHYLGLDVHDVGSYEEPLQPGVVITIEPGLYLRDEGIGIRIEDNYLITAQGAECLSENITKG